jgi:glycosyltransferase involved in cell wall biosynthesis
VLDPSGPLHHVLRDDGVDVHPLGGRGGGAGAVLRLAGLLRSLRPDVMEAYGFRAALAARAARVLAARRVPLLVGVRGLHIAEAENPDDARTRLILGIERRLRRSVTGYDTNSQGARDFLVARGFPPQKFIVIPNGVEPLESGPRLSSGSDESFRVICVARFVPRKRQAILVDAIAALLASGLDVQCEFVGDGPTRAAVETAATRLPGAFSFAGRLAHDAVVERLRQADVFVLCSLWEGMPGSVLEAMSIGLPVVVTDVSGTREVVEDGVSGLLVSPADASSLAAAIERLAQEPGLARSLGEAGQARALDRYSFSRLVQDKEAYFTTVAQIRP